MIHNEWLAEAAKPLQHTMGTETKTAIWDGVGYGVVAAESEVDAPTLTVVPLAMTSARRDPSGAICRSTTTNRTTGSPPNAKARRPESKFWKEPGPVEIPGVFL
jgi:hypothetical protein